MRNASPRFTYGAVRFTAAFAVKKPPVAMRRLAEEHLAELPMAMRRVLGGKRPAEAVDGPELVARMRDWPVFSQAADRLLEDAAPAPLTGGNA